MSHERLSLTTTTKIYTKENVAFCVFNRNRKLRNNTNNKAKTREKIPTVATYGKKDSRTLYPFVNKSICGKIEGKKTC